MPTDRIIRFADFELDVERYQLRRAGEQVRLERLPMDLLILLASRHGELISRADIVERLWRGNPYRDTENGINTAIRKIRIALDDDPLKPRHLVTVKGKGYRLDGADFASQPDASATNAADDADALDTSGAHSAVRVLVLPFANLTGDGNQEYLCSALADEISATLGTIGALGAQPLRLIAQTTAARYRDTAKTIGEIARELKLDYVLEKARSRAKARVRAFSRA